MSKIVTNPNAFCHKGICLGARKIVTQTMVLARRLLYTLPTSRNGVDGGDDLAAGSVRLLCLARLRSANAGGVVFGLIPREKPTGMKTKGVEILSLCEQLAWQWLCWLL